MRKGKAPDREIGGLCLFGFDARASCYQERTKDSLVPTVSLDFQSV